MRLVLFEFGPDQKLEVTQDSSLKCLGQPAQISLDSAVLAVRPAIIDKRRVQPVIAIFQLAFHQCLCSVVFWPQLQGTRHVATCSLRSVNKWSEIYSESGSVHHHLLHTHTGGQTVQATGPETMHELWLTRVVRQFNLPVLAQCMSSG